VLVCLRGDNASSFDSGSGIPPVILLASQDGPRPNRPPSQIDPCHNASNPHSRVFISCDEPELEEILSNRRSLTIKMPFNMVEYEVETEQERKSSNNVSRPYEISLETPLPLPSHKKFDC